MIAGLDPGITTAIAILDSNGNVLDIYSKRDMTRAEIIRHILGFGTPVIISTDVNRPPRSVEKIATKLGCVTYSPDASLSVGEKRELIREYYQLLKNDHEVDALSSALKAWKHYRGLFNKVSDFLKKFGRQEIFADVMLKLLKEKSPNIENATRKFIEKEKLPVAIEKISKEETVQRELVEKLQKKLGEKQQLIDTLKNQNTLISRALNESRKELSRLKGTKHEIGRTEDYQELKNLLDYIKKLRRIENKGYYPVIKFEKLDGNLVEEMDNRIDLNGRVILSSDKENLSLLNERNIKCLLTFDKLEESEIKNLEFPVVQIDKDILESFDNIKVAKIDYIERLLVDAKKSGLIGWLKGYRKRKD